MAVWRRNLFDFDDFEKNVSSLFSDFRQLNNQQGGSALLSPHFDVRENESHFIIHGELAGVKKEDIQIDFSRGVLHIKGEKKQEQKQENEKYHVVERRFGSFERRMKLPTAAKPEEIKATFNDGILELLIPKAFEQNQESRVLIG
jgi:HSP20 family protein